jgi:hypothetical protein
MKKYFLIVFLTLLYVASAFSQVTYTISNVTATMNNYDRNAINTSALTVTVTRNSTVGNTNFYLLIGSTAYGSNIEENRRVYLNPANLYDSSSKIRIRLTTNATSEIGSQNLSSDVELAGTISNGQSSRSLTFYVSSSTGEIPDGTYTNIFTFSLYVGSQTAPNGTLTPATGGNLTVSLTSVGGETFSISFTSSIADFGEINPAGDEALTTMRVTAPQRYTISAYSKNSSILINPNSPSETIPYTFYFNGTIKSLSSGLVQLVYDTNARTDWNYPLRFVTGPIGFFEAGDYTDIVTFMFTSQ